MVMRSRSVRAAVAQTGLHLAHDSIILVVSSSDELFISSTITVIRIIPVAVCPMALA